jgi:hypothetical protein
MLSVTVARRRLRSPCVRVPPPLQHEPLQRRVHVRCATHTWRGVRRAGAHRVFLRPSRSQGSITKTGNTHARRLLIEAAWHHAKPYRVPGKTMRDRWELAPPAARVRGHEGNRRLHQRWQGFNARKKRPAVADVAIARELAGWARSLAVLE